MWTCKHCNGEFDFDRTTDKANHSRHCDQNPKRQESYVKLSAALVDRQEKLYGPVASFSVTCYNCEAEFEVQERSKLFPQKEKYFCTRSCANSQGGKARSENIEANGGHHYTTICFKYHERKCVVCGFDKIVAVHHFDEDHSNDAPENLIPLCPNHHSMIHSRWKTDVIDIVEAYIENNGELVKPRSR